MNRAEYIIATIDRADKDDRIDHRDSMRVLIEVAGLLNSGMTANEIDEFPAMEKLWREVGKKWGKI